MNGSLPAPRSPAKSDEVGPTPQERAILEKVARERKIPLVSFGEARASLDGEVRASTPGVEPQSFVASPEPSPKPETVPKPGGGAGRGIIIKLLILLVLIWVVFWFNYFGLINLNQYLPWLPTASLKTSSTKVDQNITKDVTPQPNVSTVLGGQQIPCPSTAEFCTNGKDIVQNGAYAGLGANVASGSAIYAVFDGEMTTVSSIYPPELNREKIAAIYLDNKEKGLRAAYFFKGEVPVAKKVKAGEIIGKTGGELASYNNVSLLFQLIQGDPVKGERLKLSSQDFTN